MRAPVQLCTQCDRPMRPSGTLITEFPGTVPRSSRTVCQTCYVRVGKPSTRPLKDPKKPEPVKPVLMDDTIVPVHTWLRPHTFRTLAVHGQARGLTVSELLSRLADAATRSTT